MTHTTAALRPSWRPSWLPHFPAKAWYHALGTYAAAMLAFYVACALELDSPGSAVVTVLIVSSPLPGMVLSKGLWRFIGTLVGLAISVALIARFAQSPFAFILALAIWLGICTYTSSLLRHFRAYAAVLAGYTISLVALPALDDPDQIFYLATGRIAVVTVGIVCTALVKSLLALQVGQLRLQPALEGALSATADLAARALDLEPGLPERRRAVAERLAALDPLIVAAANESAQTAQQAPAVRLFVSILVNLLTLATSVREALAALRFESPVAAAITPLRDMVRDLLRTQCGTAAFLSPTTGEALAAARQAGQALTAELTAAPATVETLDALALAIRLEDVVDQLTLARDLLDDIEHDRTGRKVTPVSYHRDRQAAVINGLRAAIATLIAGSFWIATAWSSGTQMLAALLPVCALLGTTDAPEQASIAFTRGIALGAVCAFVCEFYLLASVDGFPLLVVMVAPFLVTACLYSTLPKHAGSSTAFLIFFTTFLSLRNPMQYDVAQALNTDVAFVLGSACGVLVFRTLWPANQARSVRRLMAQMRDDVGDLARRRMPASPTVWETTMLDRLSRLGTRLATSPERAAVIEGGMAAIHIGRDMMRAHHWLGGLALPPDPARRVEAAWAALCRVEAAPDAAIETMRIAAARLLAAAGELEPPAERGRLLRVAADFHDIALLLTRHRRFFEGTLPTRAAMP
ncbi:fusaric acid resistance protein [Aliidongia dinghuensis]|uniref:Fusaric acid resistance protein n=1 Tax=Aliidongia dinghuensis TaxID=1867774 RepID=A0A8J3E6H8_9PROT|nr:FUSC family protein [Aliidongia dinghuensis]GGF29962.1 fusaric acid resistance protein [Aliidongia dinghuensis]